MAQAFASASQKSAPTLASLRAMPPYWQLAGFSAVFAGGGYMIAQGDPINGSGTVTAWSLMYLAFNSRYALKHPVGAALTLGTLVLGTGVHGSFYFDRKGWKGAVPGMTTQA